MQFAPKTFILLLFAVLLSACPANESGNSNSNRANQTANLQNSPNSNTIKDNVDELELMIKMPFHPEEAVWREENFEKADVNRLPAPTGKKLIAVLRFLEADADKIVAQAEKYKPGADVKINTESWFPAELIAQSQTSGDDTVKGKSYPANDFYNPPYTDGRVTRIEGTDYFVLELFGK